MAYSSHTTGSCSHHYLYQQVKPIPSIAHNIDELDGVHFPIFPLRDGQTIQAFCDEVGMENLKSNYKTLLNSYKQWIVDKNSSSAHLSKNFDSLHSKIFGFSNVTVLSFRTAIFGSALSHLLAIRRLLDDPSIPIETRKESCDDIAYRITKCTGSLLGDLQACHAILEAAKQGCLGSIQKDRINLAKQLALQVIKKISYSKIWEIHLISYLTNRVAKEYGLPIITEDYFIKYQYVSSIITSEVVEEFKYQMALKMSPAGVYRTFISRCLDCYKQALVSTNTYAGRDYLLEQVPSGDISTQFEINTASIREFVKDFDVSFNWLFTETQVSKTESTYRLSIITLRFKLMQHIEAYFQSKQNQSDKGEHIEFHVLSRTLSGDKMHASKQLCFAQQMYFYILEDGVSRPLTLSDLIQFNMNGFSESKIFDLCSEAITNTIDLKTLNHFYCEQLNQLGSQRLIKALTEVLINQLQEPDVIAATTEWINKQHLYDSLKEDNPFIMKHLKHEAPTPVLVALSKRSYLMSPTVKLKAFLLVLKHIQYLSASFLHHNFLTKELISCLKAAVDTDHGDACSVLIAIPELAKATFSYNTIIQRKPTRLHVNIIQYCVIKHANHCLRVVLQENPKLLKTSQLTVSRLEPLHLAAIFHNLKALDMLLKAGVDVNIKGLYGFTVMHWAIYYQHIDIIRRLLSNKPRPNLSLKDLHQKSCYDLAKSNPHINRLILNNTIVASIEGKSLEPLNPQRDSSSKTDEPNYVLVSFVP
ncbi:ankyrin repeat domain-containing protein [Parashewanella spongiae]|uniref:Ankyrin repeat domain-containing protein n=1 Tax=Parashewanella spongiae TaxID=342950 RepID=A0A3A6TZE0_9GAMM|nr:ankyrin repeat domain-containing protein [Parashewanella spongiae]MCL1077434.1 ankyrin repeat domain-containing protein [Parashewanella spongiae]RJY18350.1 ankyrin repeat domain-containing protein [Parashewanella spongiae]